MAWLKIYEWEQSTYKEFRDVAITRSEAEKYLRKFARHFKVNVPRVDYSRVKRNGGGSYYARSQMIRLSHGTNLGTVCHEFAHHLNSQLNGGVKLGHDKGFKKQLKKVYTFAKRYLPKPKPIYTPGGMIVYTA